MKSIKNYTFRLSHFAMALAFLGAVVAPVVAPAGDASAGQITSRKVTLGSSADGNTSTDANGAAVTAGNGGNGAATKHAFTFTPSGASIGSIAFMYCTTPFEGTTCAVPASMDASAVNAVTEDLTGAYSINTAVNTSTASGTGYFANDNNVCGGGTGGRTNCILINAASGTAESGAKNVTFGAGANWIKNPITNGTYYVRILTFSDNAFTTLVDNGTVAFAITDEINIEAKVQEQLKFSVSSSSATAEGASCAALTGNALLSLGNAGVLDAATAYDTHSYFRVSTNGALGTVVHYAGDTLKTTVASGGYSITAPAGPTQSTVGSEQFGIQINTGNGAYSNEDLTTFPGTAYDSGTLSNGTITNLGTAQFGYDTNSVSTPVALAQTPGNQIVACSTVAVRYIANISPNTEPGIYRTTVTYIATPTF